MKATRVLPLHRRDSIGAAYHVLTFDAGEALAARAGQFAMVRGASWGDAPLLPRPMSLLSAGTRPSILVKVVGRGTSRMAHAEAGELFHLLSPLGRPFRAPQPERRPVLVAGGVGVAPLLFFARELSRGAHDAPGAPPGTGPEPLALYGGRTAADLPLDEELASLSELHVATEDGSRGVHGRVTGLLDAALSEHGADGRLVEVYTCGPDRMMAAVAAICAAQGVPCQASLETPMACGYGVCLGCPVPRAGGGYLYACTEGPCVDASAVDWERSKGT